MRDIKKHDRKKKKVKGKFVIKLKNMITKSSTNYNDKLQLDCESKYLGEKIKQFISISVNSSLFLSR